jgi:hypothetical protein
LREERRERERWSGKRGRAIETEGGPRLLFVGALSLLFFSFLIVCESSRLG